MKLTPNPFIYTRAVSSREFIGREREIRQIYGLLLGGQSAAITGQPHIGKTSLLKHILDEQMRQKICGNKFEKDTFSFIDAQMLENIDTQAGFWEKALAPLTIKMQTGVWWIKNLASTYEFVQRDKFGNFVLQQLFNELSKVNSRFILLLDEFDVLLSTRLHSTEFYGGLRSLASCARGLVLVIASRRNINQLTDLTKNINPYGSPYFNIFQERSLKAFSEDDMFKLLKQNITFEKQKDLSFITEVSGNHPYLAQLVAAKLWEAHAEGHKGYYSYFVAGKELHQQAKLHLTDTWQYWSSATRKAAIAVGLVQISRELGGTTIKISELFDNLSDYRTELESLKDNGTLAQDKAGEWKISQAAFLWSLAEHLRLYIRDEFQFKTWLQQNEIDNMLTNRERENLFDIARKVILGLEKGVTTLIENFVKRFAADNGEVPPPPPPPLPQKMKILFLAADPTDASRLRLGEEFRKIQEKLKLARHGRRFPLEIPELSLRREDISQALFDKKPQILHFSGHGSASGALCFEDEIGRAHLVEPEALADLLRKFADHLKCVILNACNTKLHAKAIAKHIDYAIGMKKAISDQAAIAFSVGFYQALGAGKTIEEAFEFGQDQIGMLNLSEKQIPVLEKK